MGTTESKEKPLWKPIKHVWGGSTELTMPPHHTMWVLFEDGMEQKWSRSIVIGELKRQGKLNLLSWSHLDPKEMEEQQSFMKLIQEKS